MTNEEKKWKIMEDYDEIKFFVTDDDTMCNYGCGEIYMNEKEFNKCTNIILFDLLHEIGHVKNTKITMPVYYGEYVATKWAIEHCSEYGIKIPAWRKNDFQNDIYKKRDEDTLINRLKHRKGSLILNWEA